MADGKVTCACGKQYAWKPELAGKRAKCKCGNVVSFPAQRPGEDEAPEGFGDMDEIPMAPPPPPPPMAGGGAPPPPPPPVAGTRGTIARGTMPKSGGRAQQQSSGFQFSGKALWNLIIGVGLIGFGIFEYISLSGMEAEGRTPRFGRRSGWLRLMYTIGGKWGVLAFFALIGLGLIAFAVLVMLGKKSYDDSE